MKRYTVHAPADLEDAAERAVFIKDGMSWLALIVPLLWILWHRLWTVLVWWIAFALLVAWTGRLMDDDAAVILACLGQLLFALEANNYRRSALERRGWDDLGGSYGADKDEAELRYFGNLGATTPEALMTGRGETRLPLSVRQPDRSEGTVMGLFPEPQR